MSEGHLGAPGADWWALQGGLPPLTQGLQRSHCELSTQWREESSSAVLSRVQLIGDQPHGSMLPGRSRCSAVFWAGSGETLKRVAQIAQDKCYLRLCSFKKRKGDASRVPQGTAALGLSRTLQKVNNIFCNTLVTVSRNQKEKIIVLS